MNVGTTALRWIQGPIGRVIAGVRALWAYLRRVSGDDAYDRYVAHLRACHPDVTPLSAREYFRRRHEEKWSQPSRCC